MDVSRPDLAARRGHTAAWLIALLLLPTSGLLGQEAPAEPPADWGPISFNVENWEYPFPVDYMPFRLYGQDVRLAYMDVAPAGTSNPGFSYRKPGRQHGAKWK